MNFVAGFVVGCAITALTTVLLVWRKFKDVDRGIESKYRTVGRIQRMAPVFLRPGAEEASRDLSRRA